MLSKCTRNCKGEKIWNITFSNISTGAYSFPKDLASEISFHIVKTFLEQNEFPKKVIFCCYDFENLESYMNVLKTNIES